VAAVAELAVLPVAEQQRPERSPRAFSLREAADDELGALHRLDLEPGLRALASLVAAVLPLGDDALETTRERRLVELVAVLLRVDELNVGRGQQALLQPAPAIGIRRGAEVEAGEVQHVEAEVDRRRGAVGRGDLALGLELEALLHRRERRPAVGAEG